MRKAPGVLAYARPHPTRSGARTPRGADPIEPSALAPGPAHAPGPTPTRSPGRLAPSTGTCAR